MGNTVQLTKNGQPVFPVTDVSLVMGLQDAIKLPPVKVTTLPTASAETAGKMYYVGPDANDEYERYITSATGGSYEWIDLGDTDIPLPSIADNLTTDDANTALSARQGKVLNEEIGDLDIKMYKANGAIGSVVESEYAPVYTYTRTPITSGNNSYFAHFEISEGESYRIVINPNGYAPSSTPTYAIVLRATLVDSVTSVDDPNIVADLLKLTCDAYTGETITLNYTATAPSHYLQFYIGKAATVGDGVTFAFSKLEYHTIVDDTLEVEGVPSDSKAVGDVVLRLADNFNKSTSPNLFDKSQVTTGIYIRKDTGATASNADWCASALIDISGMADGESITTLKPGSYSGVIGVAFYNSNKVFTHGGVAVNTKQSGDVYYRASIPVSGINTSMIYIGTAPESYVPYGTLYTLKPEAIEGATEKLVKKTDLLDNIQIPVSGEPVNLQKCFIEKLMSMSEVGDTATQYWQSIDVYGSYVYQGCNRTTGPVLTITNLLTGEHSTIAFNETGDWHMNNLICGQFYTDSDEHPLLYVSEATGNGACAVVRLSNDLTSYTVLQRITYTGEFSTGSFNWLINDLTGQLCITARVGQYINVLSFAFPSISNAEVTLTDEDVIEEKTIYYAAGVGQGTRFINGRIYAPIGYGTAGSPSYLSIIDLQTESVVTTVPFGTSLGEVEAVAPYRFGLLANTFSGNLYYLQFS